MSVLIRGFEKPDHCLRCPMKGIDDECVLQGVEVCDEYEDWEQQMANCPLVPAADVKPVIHAHWYVDDGCAYCSNCRNNFKKAILKEAKYCPMCGAQIDGYGGHPDAGPPTPYDLLYEEGGPDA